MIVVDSLALAAISVRAYADELLTTWLAVASLDLGRDRNRDEPGGGRAFGPAGSAELDVLAAKLDLELAPVDPAQVAAAREAFRRFGGGRRPAALNFGDLFAYALAKVRSLPLLSSAMISPDRHRKRHYRTRMISRRWAKA